MWLGLSGVIDNGCLELFKIICFLLILFPQYFSVYFFAHYNTLFSSFYIGDSL